MKFILDSNNLTIKLIPILSLTQNIKTGNDYFYSFSLLQLLLDLNSLSKSKNPLTLLELVNIP